MTMTMKSLEQLLELPSKEALDRILEKTKGRLFFKKGASWLGSLLTDHQLIWDPYCSTAWCDGSTIGFNPWFFMDLGKDQKVTLLAHELYHTMLDHSGRLEGRDPELWNQAADYVINNDLDRMGYCFVDMDPLLDHQYDGMTTEEVYEHLLKDQPPPPPPMPMPEDCPEEGKIGDEPAEDPGSSPTDEQGKEGKGQHQSPGTATLTGDLRSPPKGSSRHATIAKIVAAVQAAKQSQDAGSLPGEMQQIIDSFLDPVLPWELLLKRYFTEMSKDDYSWKRPNRRYEDVYLPTLMGDNGLTHLIYYLDVSGSITDAQALRFFSEVRYIHNELRPIRLTLVTFDHRIQDEYDFFQDDPFEKITINGRGGTCLEPVYQHIKQHQPTAAIIFSDMYVAPMLTPPGPPVLWVVMDNPKAKVTHGKVIHLTKAQIG